MAICSFFMLSSNPDTTSFDTKLAFTEINFLRLKHFDSDTGISEPLEDWKVEREHALKHELWNQ
jgi:hypothetical protein